MNKLKELIAEISYDSERYGGRVAYFKRKGMQGKVSIFKTGKMISVGTTSEDQAKKELLLARDVLVEKDVIQDVIIRPIMQNFVVSVDFLKPIQFDVVSQKINTIYEPEQFPGAIVRIKTPSEASLLLFSNGKVIITGLKDIRDAKPTINAVKKLIE